MELLLIRLTANPDSPQRGALLIDGEPEMVTLELPWLKNQPRISCIPEGIYDVRKVRGRTTLGGSYLPTTFELMDVPNRSGILIHPGNSAKNSMGCILLGTSFGELYDQPAVLGSRAAFAKLASIVPNKFTLTIKHI